MSDDPASPVAAGLCSDVAEEGVCARGTSPNSTQRLIVACVALAGFIYQFEANLVNVALPTIRAQLNLTTSEVTLLPICYLIGATVALIPAGRLGWRYGLKRVFIISVCIMTLATTLCALSPNLFVLVGGRLLQGMGAGGMASLGYAVISSDLPPSLAGYGFGRLSMAVGLGMLAGNPAGGFLAQFMPWRFVFFSTVPLMLVLVLISSWSLPGHRRSGEATKGSIGLVDSLLVGLTSAGAVVLLSFGHEFGFLSAPILPALIASPLLAALLVFRGARGKLAFLPREMIAHRMFVISLVSMVLVCSTMSGISFLMPFYHESLCGLSPAASSLLMLFNAAAYALVAPFAGGMADRGRSGFMVAAAAAVGVVACGLFSIYSGLSQWAYALVFLVAVGAADGMFSPSANRAALSPIPEELREQAAVFLPLAIVVGSALGVAIFETIFSHDVPVGVVSLPGGGSRSAISDTLAHGFTWSLAAGSLIWLYVFLLNIRAGWKRSGDGDNG